MAGKWTRATLLVSGLLVTVTSASMIPAEIAASRPVAGELPAARSVEGQREQMIACIGRLRAIDAAQAGRSGAAEAQSCLGLAESILARSPTRSAAHLVRAVSLQSFGETERAAAALDMARATGANEGWLAVVRIRAALMIAADAGPSNIRKGMELAAATDLAVVAGPGRLSARLALLYHEAGARKDWFITEIEALSVPAQTAFLHAVARLTLGQEAE